MNRNRQRTAAAVWGGLRSSLIAAIMAATLVGLHQPAYAMSSTFGPGIPAWNAYYANPNDPTTWNAFCHGGGGSVAAIADGVPACGPTGYTTIDVPPPNSPGSTPGFQCTELVARFEWVKYGLRPIGGNGAQVAGAYANASYAGVDHIVLVHNGTAGQAPRIGDVLSFSNRSDFSDMGHTSVVVDSQVDPQSGAGYVKTLNQNFGMPIGQGSGVILKLDVSNWNVSGSQSGGFRYVEWATTGASTSEFHIAYQAQTDHLSQIWWANGAWNGPQDLGISAASAPAAATYNHELHYVYRGTNGYLTQVWWANGAWHGPQDFGISAISAPAAATYINGSTPELHYVYLGINGHLTQVWWANGAWHGPQDLGFSAESGAAAVTYNNEFHLVYLGTNGDLTQIWYVNGTWHDPQDFGIHPAWVAPAAATYINGSTPELHYVYLGTNSDLTQIWWANGAWHGPQDFGVKALNTPAAATY